MRRPFFALLLILLAVGVAKAGPAAAAMLGDARVPFQAERTVTINGRTYTGPLFHIPGHERHEQELWGTKEVFILDAKAAKGWLLVPSFKTYVEFAFPPVMAELDSPDLTRHPVGQETIAGVRTTKYRIDHTAADGTRAQGYVWVSPDGVLMKLAGTITRRGGKPLRIAMELSHLEEGPQDPSLFELPPGLVKLPADALRPLLGGRPG
jgi:hypothetical protein